MIRKKGLDNGSNKPGNEEAVWVKTNRVCVVEYMPNMHHSLRQPVFKGLCDDVIPEEVQMQADGNN